MVVKITPPASAGSIFSFERSSGKKAPEKAATTKFVMIANAIIRLKSKSANQ